MTLVFFDGPRTVLMLDDVAGATGCAADRFSSVAEIKCLIHGGPIMYRRTWAATIEGHSFPCNRLCSEGRPQNRHRCERRRGHRAMSIRICRPSVYENAQEQCRNGS